ncbi:MAG: putative glycoside hydrolase [Acidimicrobiales bacterium]
MRLVRQASAFLLWAALTTSRGLFAQHPHPEAPAPIPTTPAELTAALRPPDVRYALPDLRFAPTRPPIKALYVNAWAFSSAKVWHLIRLADSTEINALVVDVKDDTGCLLFPMSVPTAVAIGASACRRVVEREARARLDSIRAHGIYPIARIVVAKDPMLAAGKPGWAVRHRDGGLWRDRIGSPWVDAHHDSVWIYAAQIAEEAVRFGFEEVQFDYVRFPDEPPERRASAIFAARRGSETWRDAVRRQVRMVTARLAPIGAPVTFDIFGLTATADGDLGIGQVWEDFITVADAVLPMVYPSHYARGAFGYAWPNGEPYGVVRETLRAALERSRYPGAAEIRPYLQAFTLGRRRPRYTPYEIRAQVRAAEELGIRSWVLWNPRSVYQRDALRPYRETAQPAALSESPP